MRLLLDLGNTRLKWAFANADGVLSPMQALEHSAEAQCWQPLLDAVSQSQMGSIFLSSVAGARADQLIALLHAQTGLSVQRASSPAQFQNWRSGYLAPAALGVDRFLGMLGALNVWPAQMRVVALVGTALTIDVVQPDGQHLGGLIAPGPSLMQASLHRSTADLPLGGGQYAALAHATRDAIYSGSVAAAAALIQRVVATYTNSQLILSGGAAQMLLPALNERPQWPRLDLQPDLVLRGLWRYAEAEQATG